jgi:hypothetical protein
VDVRRLSAERRDRVDVEVQDRVAVRRVRPVDPRFLPHLPHRGVEDRPVVRVHVAPGLQPAAELAVRNEEHGIPRRPCHDGARRHVPVRIGSAEGVGARQERPEPAEPGLVVRLAGPIGPERSEEGLATVAIGNHAADYPFRAATPRGRLPPSTEHSLEVSRICHKPGISTIRGR